MATSDFKLKHGRLIPAGVKCPFSEICPDAKNCNRPQNMALDFSCGTARGFARLLEGGSLAQAQTVVGISEGSSTSRAKPDLMSFFKDEVISDEARKPGRPGRNPKRA